MSDSTLVSFYNEALRVQMPGLCDDKGNQYTVSGADDTFGNFHPSPAILTNLGNKYLVQGASTPVVYDALTGNYVEKPLIYAQAVPQFVIPAGFNIQTTAALDNWGFQGVHGVFNLGGITSGDLMIVKIIAVTTLFKNYVLFTTNYIGADGTYSFKIAPSCANVPGISVSDYMPRQFYVQVISATAGAITVDVELNWVG